MKPTSLVRPGHQTVAIAAVELAETLHHLFPKAVVKPSEPYEDEDICLKAFRTCSWGQGFPSLPYLHRFRFMAPATGHPRIFVW